MHIMQVGNGFKVIESPTADGAFLKVWPPTFRTRRAAELLMEELVAFYTFCDPEEFYGASADAEICAEHFEEIATVWGSLEQQGVANLLELARNFCAHWPVYLNLPRTLH